MFALQVLTVRVWGLVGQRWLHPCQANLVGPYGTKVHRSSFFEGDQPRTKTCPVHTCVPPPFLELCTFFAAGVRDSALLEGQNFVLCGRHKTSDTFSSAWQAQYFMHVAKMLASVGQNERPCRLPVFFAWQAQCGELGWCFFAPIRSLGEKTSDAWASFFDGQDTYNKCRTNRIGTVMSNVAPGINFLSLVVARYSSWYRSRNPLVTLFVLDSSHCGAVFILISLV